MVGEPPPKHHPRVHAAALPALCSSPFVVYMVPLMMLLMIRNIIISPGGWIHVNHSHTMMDCAHVRGQSAAMIDVVLQGAVHKCM